MSDLPQADRAVNKALNRDAYSGDQARLYATRAANAANAAS